LLIRYYGVGVINTAFGYGLYSALVLVGLNLFLAQIISHCVGLAFNYFMFKRHVFREHHAPILPYIAAYVFNYFLGLLFLFTVHLFIPSPFVAGFLALVAVSAINFFVLKHMVFVKRFTQTSA
jgi:putative flippase GtrA